ncbi:N-acetylglucosamine kinase [Streptomyces sp. TP-A0874]|uniref:N-acetylglucosamine kinase n=1 Tax=Streptomyces sp. TP-A0874 TaxID=549819 RepID=UPI000852EC88|nr:BadF/BadG/BcrA/BcrD ATPase family protein [Streptomyces sp. TP-A0874]
MKASERSAADWVLGVDSGGSGLRITLAPAAAEAAPPRGAITRVITRRPVRTGPSGIDAAHLLDSLLPAARELLAEVGVEAPAAVAIGAAGMATLGEELRSVLPDALAEHLAAPRLALAADAVTAYAGALGQRAGAVVAAGTGLIALGVAPRPDGHSAAGAAPDTRGGWLRADGWGHLLGDCGGGAWIGRAGLEAALRAHDGRAGGSAVLLAALESRFGRPEDLPALLYPRGDRPAVLASFAPEVGHCAAHDPVAAGILRSAAGHIAEAAAAVCPASEGCPVALTGGLFKMGEPLLGPLRRELAARLPGARPALAAGDPLDGALRIAGALARDELRLPVDGRMLQLP